MPQATWTAVDEYLGSLLLPSEPAFAATLAASAAAGLPAIAVSPLQGQLLAILARAQRASAILEIGTLGGYSTLWLAKALSTGGRLVSLELNPTHAAVARSNLSKAGFDPPAVEIQVGPAVDSLRALVDRGELFDFIFIDADKTGYPKYLEMALALSRRGTVIVADNVVRDGAVADPSSSDPDVIAVRQYLSMVAADSRLTATTIQTVGTKGYDGLAIALVTSDPDLG